MECYDCYLAMDFMGQGRKAIDLFANLKAGVRSNYIPFTCVLSACSHFWLLEDGTSYFESMEWLGIAQKLNNYPCMVCTPGRAGQLSEAEKLLVSMPMDEWSLMQVHWDLCLGACPIYGSNLNIAGELQTVFSATSLKCWLSSFTLKHLCC